MFQAQVAVRIKTHIVCSVTFFTKICRFVTKCGKMSYSGTGHMTIWLTRIACWVPKATNTLTQVV